MCFVANACWNIAFKCLLSPHEHACASIHLCNRPINSQSWLFWVGPWSGDCCLCHWPPVDGQHLPKIAFQTRLSFILRCWCKELTFVNLHRNHFWFELKTKKKRLQKMHNDVVYIFQAGTNKLRQRTGFAGFVVGYHITGWKCAVMRDHRSVDRVVYGHLSMSDKRFLIVFDLGPPFSAIWISNLAKHHHRKRKTKNFMVFFLCAFVRSLYFFFLFLFDIIISH